MSLEQSLRQNLKILTPPLTRTPKTRLRSFRGTPYTREAWVGALLHKLVGAHCVRPRSWESYFSFKRRTPSPPTAGLPRGRSLLQGDPLRVAVGIAVGENLGSAPNACIRGTRTECLHSRHLCLHPLGSNATEGSCAAHKLVGGTPCTRVCYKN